MNYQHSYHAGNFADVFKHWLLMLILEALQKKPTPFVYLDSHAGAGLYDLRSDNSQKGDEACEGIHLLWDNYKKLNSSLKAYLDLIKKFQFTPERLVHYPGSPCIARHLLRPQDKMILNELHPAITQQLKTHFKGDTQVSIHSQDAYQWLKAILPPPLSRGVVLIDPPYEQKDDYDQIIKLLPLALKRWRQGIYVIWYPITKNHAYKKLLQAVKMMKLNEVLDVQLCIHNPDSPIGLNGSGMLIINPPWQLDAEITHEITNLWTYLSPQQKGKYQLLKL